MRSFGKRRLALFDVHAAGNGRRPGLRLVAEPDVVPRAFFATHALLAPTHLVAQGMDAAVELAAAVLIQLSGRTCAVLRI